MSKREGSGRYTLTHLPSLADDFTAASMKAMPRTPSSTVGNVTAASPFFLLRAARLAAVTSLDALQACLPSIATELRASSVLIAAPDEYSEAAQVLSGDGSRLNVPITHGGVVVGHLVASASEPWSRHQIARARMVDPELRLRSAIEHEIDARNVAAKFPEMLH